MFFYIDESGHTGKNLFDPTQVNLYYGLISSKVNLDVLGKKYFYQIRKQLEVQTIHAKNLSLAKISGIIPQLITLQKKLQFRFSIFRIKKSDHALISFFDQVFDQGVNPAYTWTGYWTPLRYVMLIKLASLFDTEMLKQAWAARIEMNSDKSEKIFCNLCEEIIDKLDMIPDERSKQLIKDTLTWAKENYHKLSYNVTDKESLSQITPNLIGFQFVLHHIAYNLSKHKRTPSKIIVDKQIEFNKSQTKLSDHYAALKKYNELMSNGPGLPELDFRNMPSVPLTHTSSNDSLGLQLVDLFLWIFQRALANKEITKEIQRFIHLTINKVDYGELSIDAIIQKANTWIQTLPNLTTDDIKASKKLGELEEKRRLNAVNKLD
tara:strand:- start:757 stop:1890 length:1134 start_codon:yes stop_codon:yes gene_type:complete